MCIWNDEISSLTPSIDIRWIFATSTVMNMEYSSSDVMDDGGGKSGGGR